MNRIINFVLCISVCMVLFACGRDSAELFNEDDIFATEVDVTEVGTTESKLSVSTNTKPATVCIYICGAVKKPGVYNFYEGARVVEAIDAAGGYTDEANDGFWNQAQLMSDGMMIYVPTIGEAVDSAGGTNPVGNTTEDNTGKININTAGKEELMSLTGIGQSKAESIINYRTEHGEFTSVEDIMLVSGIGNSLYEKVREYITVN